VHVVALVERPDHVCCRYRITAFRPYLERAGHTIELCQLPLRWWSWLGLGRALRTADVVVLQRRLLTGWQRFLLRRTAQRLAFDFDDAVFLRDSYARRGLHSTARRRRFAGIIRAADLVIAGNPFLGDQARQVAGDKVQVIPTCVDPDGYRLANHVRAGAGVQLVWVGSGSTLRGLEVVRPLLEEVGRRVPGVRLKLVCDQFLRLDHLPVIECAWDPTTEAADIAAADIGISHLPDDLWSRGKCGLKVLQYMAAGLPVVANPVGVQKDFIRHGQNGFLVDTPDQWAEAIRRLASEPGLRREMGLEGRGRVERDFGVGVGASRWVKWLDRFGRGRGAA
jgi:glycosyltransferase involved in cell wall biosynthesis